MIFDAIQIVCIMNTAIFWILLQTFDNLFILLRNCISVYESITAIYTSILLSPRIDLGIPLVGFQLYYHGYSSLLKGPRISDRSSLSATIILCLLSLIRLYSTFVTHGCHRIYNQFKNRDHYRQKFQICLLRLYSFILLFVNDFSQVVH